MLGMRGLLCLFEAVKFSDWIEVANKSLGEDCALHSIGPSTAN